MSAPRLSNACTTWRCPFVDAWWSGVLSYTVCASTFAPDAINRSTSFTFPSSAARCNAVTPSAPTALIFAFVVETDIWTNEKVNRWRTTKTFHKNENQTESTAKQHSQHRSIRFTNEPFVCVVCCAFCVIVRFLLFVAARFCTKSIVRMCVNNCARKETRAISKTRMSYNEKDKNEKKEKKLWTNSSHRALCEHRHTQEQPWFVNFILHRNRRSESSACGAQTGHAVRLATASAVANSSRTVATRRRCTRSPKRSIETKCQPKVTRFLIILQ